MTIRSTRRRFVIASVAAAGGLALSRLPFAQTAKPSPMPTVDTLTIRVLTDSSYDTPRVSQNVWVKVKRAPVISPLDYRRTLHNEWGLSLALESRRGADVCNLMLDFGYTPDALLNNMEIMRVDGTKARAMIVSHGHYDHFGGLIAFLKKNRAQLPRDFTLYVGGEDNFCTRKIGTATPGHFTDWGTLDRRELQALDVKVVTCERPTVVGGHAFTTGTIQRRTFEKVMPGNPVVYSKSNGLGCDIPELNAKAGGKPVFDEHVNEHGTCFNVTGRGLVVISSCGHAGIINTVRQAQDVSGVKKVHAVMGGFHLFPAEPDYVQRVVAELKALDPDVVIPMHCSGPNFVAAVREALPDRVIGSTTGTELEFGT